MAPGYTGLYQVNVTIPAVPTNDWYLYLDAYDSNGNDGGLAVESTLNVSGAAAGSSVTGHSAAAHAARRPLRAMHGGMPRSAGKKPVSGRLPHLGSQVTQ
jgi:hypothetical protein